MIDISNQTRRPFASYRLAGKFSPWAAIAALAVSCGPGAVPVATAPDVEATSQADAEPTGGSNPIRERATVPDTDPRFRQSRGFVVLDDPEIISGTDASAFIEGELVLGLTVGGLSRAYPVSMAAYHHIINDEVQGDPLLVTY